MSNAFNTYLQAKNAAISQGAQMLQFQQFAEKSQRDKALRNALNEGYQPARDEITLPEGIQGPVRPQIEGGMDWDRTMQAASQTGAIPELLKLRAGMLKADRTPADMLSFSIYDAMSDEKKKDVLTFKRAAQFQNIAGIPTRFLPGQGPEPLSTLDKESEAVQKLASGKAAGKTAAKDYSEIISGSKKVEEQKTLAQQALTQFQKYSQETLAGTGPFATGFGAKKYFDAETQKLEAVFRTINLKNMAATFAGMSRAIDTDAERRAWEQTQPSLTLDDPANYQIIIGILSMAAKAEAEALARREYIEQSPGNTLKGYRSPVFGQTKSMFDESGNIKIVPNDQVEQAKAAGMLTADEYMEKLSGGVAKTPEGMKQIGTSGGTPVYEDAQGNRFTQ